MGGRDVSFRITALAGRNVSFWGIDIFLFKENLLYLIVSLFLSYLAYILLYDTIQITRSKHKTKCSLTCLMSQYNKPGMSQFKH